MITRRMLEEEAIDFCISCTFIQSVLCSLVAPVHGEVTI